MAQIRPFSALRPRPDVAAVLAAPPYDVVDTEQARALAAGNPLSFLHVSRSEIDLPAGTDPYAPAVYEKAAANLHSLVAQGALVREASPSLYLYAQQMGDHRQTGLVAVCAVDDYDSNVIRKHEHTRADKELDRTRHTDVTNINSGPVFLTYRNAPALEELLGRAMASAELLYDFVAPDGVGHTLHRITDASLTDELVRAFGGVAPLYVADGHHRSASAARVGRERRAKFGNVPGSREHDWFMAVIFPHDQLQIMPYNRVVKDLNGRSEEQFLAALEQDWHLEPVKLRAYCPKGGHRVGMYLGPRWFCLTPKAGTFPEGHPTEGLDVAILQRNLLAPLLGIADPRTDKRISFVGGIHGPGRLEELVDAGEYAVAFSMHPVTLDELMAIADAGEVMPPKSTWFEPKLRSGLLIHELG